VKVFAFHLMPYRHLDLAAAEDFRSSFVVTPNRMFETGCGSLLYQEYLDQLTFAAQCGFDGVCVNEHHQSSYGLMPAPNLLASVLIDRTRGMPTRIGILGRALPLVSNPIFMPKNMRCSTICRRAASSPASSAASAPSITVPASIPLIPMSDSMTPMT